MFCSNCGTKIPENSKFCLNCGTSIGQFQTEYKEPQPEVEEVVVTSHVQQSAEAPVEKLIQPIESPVIQETVEVLSQPIETPAVQEPVTAPVGAFNQQIYASGANYKKPSSDSGAKGVLKVLLSIICCICIFATSISFLSILMFRASLAPDKIEYILDNLDVEEIIDDEDVRDSFVINVSGDEAVEIYEKSTIKDFVEDKATEYAEYILHNGAPARIKAKEIVELVEENEQLIYDLSEEKVTSYDYERIEALGKDLEDDYINEMVDVLKVCTSVPALIGLIFVTLLLCVLICIIRRSYDSLLWTGSAFTVTALLFAIAGVALKSLLAVELASEEIFLSSIGNLYLTGITLPALIYSGCILAVGIILIVVGLVLRAVKKQKLNS